jgi:hypothetical protein
MGVYICGGNCYRPCSWNTLEVLPVGLGTLTFSPRVPDRFLCGVHQTLSLLCVDFLRMGGLLLGVVTLG